MPPSGQYKCFHYCVCAPAKLIFGPKSCHDRTGQNAVYGFHMNDLVHLSAEQFACIAQQLTLHHKLNIIKSLNLVSCRTAHQFIHVMIMSNLSQTYYVFNMVTMYIIKSRLLKCIHLISASQTAKSHFIYIG